MPDRDLRVRAVLAPLLLLLVFAIYALDASGTLGNRRGVLSATVLGLLGLQGTLEYTAMLRGAGFAVARSPLLLVALLLYACAFVFGWNRLDRELYPLVLSAPALLFPLALVSLRKDRMQQGLEAQGATLLGLILFVWPFYLAQGICFRYLPSVLYVVLVCKGGDIGGYVVGRALGHRKLIPHVSPGKTVEGAMGSLIAAVLLAILLAGPLLRPDVDLRLTGAIGVGIMLNITTQTGDLIESLLKRRCGVKDSSHLLPAHGGVLDLTDSLLFSFCAWFPVLIWLTGSD